MLLISANLLQLFDAEGLPCGWVRWAWLNSSGIVVVCAMIAMPIPELRLLSALTGSGDLYVCTLSENKLVPLGELLFSKSVYHQACVYLFRTSAFDLDLLSPSVDHLSELEMKLQRAPTTIQHLKLDSNELTWFWDANLSNFAKPCTQPEPETGIWTETVVFEESRFDDSWKQSLHDWKQSTIIDWYPEENPIVLFTCFQGHQITNSVFTAYTERVNHCLQLLISDQMHLTTSNWLPCLMCPISDCSQQLTPSFILKKAVLLQQPTPPVTETIRLLRFLKHKWDL